MSTYRVTDQAQADLGEIWDAIAEFNEKAADRLISKLVNRFSALARFPESGRMRPDLAPDIRCALVKPYAIFYRIIEERVEILRVFHGARDLRSLFEV